MPRKVSLRDVVDTNILRLLKTLDLMERSCPENRAEVAALRALVGDVETKSQLIPMGDVELLTRLDLAARMGMHRAHAFRKHGMKLGVAIYRDEDGKTDLFYGRS